MQFKTSIVFALAAIFLNQAAAAAIEDRGTDAFVPNPEIATDPGQSLVQGRRCLVALLPFPFAQFHFHLSLNRKILH